MAETRLTQQEVSAVRTSDGAWNVSAVVGGYRHHKTYYGYSKRDAIRMFIAWAKREEPNPRAKLREDRRLKSSPEYNFEPLTVNDLLDPQFPRDQLYLQDQNGNMARVRVASRVKTWKRDPNRVEVSVKFGLYETIRVTDPGELFYKTDDARENPRVRQLHQYNSYRALDQFLGNRDEKKIANNTTVVRLTHIGKGITFEGHDASVEWPGGLRERVEGQRAIGVILHNTRIITFYEYGGFMLNSGGWKTVTTKQRMNQFMPDGYSIGQKDYEWTVYGPRGLEVEFEDKMTLESEGGIPPRDERENPEPDGSEYASEYGWIITADKIFDPEMDEYDDVGTAGPSTISESMLKRLKKGEGQQFKMYDDDGNHYYTGRYLGPDDESMFGPLNDFGTPNAGAVRIDYKNAAGKWEIL